MNSLRNNPLSQASVDAGMNGRTISLIVLLLGVSQGLMLGTGDGSGYLTAAGPLNLRFQAKRPSAALPTPTQAGVDDVEVGLMQGPPVPVELFLRGTEKAKEDKPEPVAPLKPLPVPAVAPVIAPPADPLGSIQPLTQDPDVVSGRILVKYFSSGPSTNTTTVLSLPFGFTPPQPVQAPSSRAVYTTNPSP